MTERKKTQQPIICCERKKGVWWRNSWALIVVKPLAVLLSAEERHTRGPLSETHTQYHPGNLCLDLFALVQWLLTFPLQFPCRNLLYHWLATWLYCVRGSRRTSQSKSDDKCKLCQSNQSVTHPNAKREPPTPYHTSWTGADVLNAHPLVLLVYYVGAKQSDGQTTDNRNNMVMTEGEWGNPSPLFIVVTDMFPLSQACCVMSSGSSGGRLPW